MKMRLCGFLFLPFLALSAHANPILGTNLSTFAVLGGGAVSNTGSTTLTGNLGVSPGTAFGGGYTFAGFGSIQPTNALAASAQSQLATAVGTLSGLTPTASVFGGAFQLGGQTLGAGVYAFSSSAFLTAGTLTLNAGGNNNASWVFQIPTTLNTAAGGNVQIINGGSNASVYWVVGSAATFGVNSTLLGNVLALSGITMQAGAKITCGRALAQTGGAVTLDTNTISIGCAGTPFTGSGGLSGAGGTVAPTPEPGSLLLFATGLIGLGSAARRRMAKAL